MQQQPKPSFFSNFKKDGLAGLIVFLIALPLCLGIAQASGAPPFSGIVAGIIGGILVGSLSSSHQSVSGPAAGLIAIVVGALAIMPFNFFLCAVMIAGAVQLILGLVKAGGIANYFPSNVIEGMLAGIGLTIIIKESTNAVGVDKQALSEGETGFQWTDVTDAIQHVQPIAVIISAVGLTILGLWLTTPFRKVRLVPAGLLVVLFGTLLNEILIAKGSPLALGDTHLVKMNVPSNIDEFLGQFTLPDFAGFANKQVWITGVVIAAVASIETLLCIEATDKLDPMKRYTSGNTELRAQGIGNIISGLIGGLPITSVIVRSSANINAGARSKLSTIIHGILLLVCAASIPALLNHIPKASLAAILLFTGYRLCRPSVFRHMWKEGGVTQFVPFVVTVIAVVSLDLLKGVGIGLIISILFMLRQNIRIPFYYQRSTYSNGDLIKLTLAQEVSFLNKASIKQTLENLPINSSVIIDASLTEYIDFDVLDLIREFHDTKAPLKGIKISLIGFKNTYKVPDSASEHDIVMPLLDADETPKRSSGNYKKLLRQLINNE
jgi:MFS superfamily sulfate permease-like transporter